MKQRSAGPPLSEAGLALDPIGWVAAASLAIGKAGLQSLAQTLHKKLAPAGIHVATVTVAGQIQPGTAFDPNRIADRFAAPAAMTESSASFTGALLLRLHSQARAR